MANNRYKKLAINSVIFAAANFGSSVLRFIIVPFYTYYLTTGEYGTVDMLSTTVSLLLPVFVLSIQDAALRYSFKKEIDHSTVLMNCYFVWVIATVVFSISYFISCALSVDVMLWGYFYAILIFQALYGILQNYTRGIGNSIGFASAGLVNTIVLLGTNVIFLAGLKMGIRGYLLALLLSYMIPSAFLLFINRNTYTFSVDYIEILVLKKMLKYSLPLIPTAMMWWVMNASDRYVITWFLGLSATGIYAVSHKIPSVMHMIYTIFQQAWQVSAIEESSAKDRAVFYGQVYRIFCDGLIMAASCIILIIRPVINMVVETSYASAWKYAPFLVISSVFSSLAGFLGINYIVSEHTFGAFVTSAITAAMNLILNIIFTPIIGMYGTALATLIGYCALWLIRSIDTQKYIRYNQNYWTIFVQSMLLLLQSLILIINIPHDYYWALGVTALIAFTGRQTIIVIARRVFSLIVQKVRKKQ